jgi:hypothetical protein
MTSVYDGVGVSVGVNVIQTPPKNQDYTNTRCNANDFISGVLESVSVSVRD